MLHPNTMRRVDYWVGIPLCFLLSIWYKFWSLLGLKNPRYSEKPKNILIIELAEMGSTVLAYPAMKKLQQLYPQAKIHFLLFDHIRESMDIIGLIPKNRVLTIRATGLFVVIWDTLRFMIKARQLNIDTTINLEMFARFSTLLSYLSGARKRVGYYRFDQEGLYVGTMFTHKVMYNPHIHTAQSFLTLVYALQRGKGTRDEVPLIKTPIDKENLSIPKRKASKQEQEQVWKILQSINPSINEKKKLIIVNPNASKLISIRKWPLSHYAQLVKKLIQDKRVYVILTGVKSEKPDAQYICNQVKNNRVLDTTGKTTLPQLLTLFSMAKLLITNDSGPAHFASLTPIHIMVFFGPETPKLYKPLTDNCTVMYSHFGCSPCVSAYNQRLSPCTNNLCLKSIQVDGVYKKVMDVMK